MGGERPAWNIRTAQRGSWMNGHAYTTRAPYPFALSGATAPGTPTRAPAADLAIAEQWRPLAYVETQREKHCDGAAWRTAMDDEAWQPAAVPDPCSQHTSWSRNMKTIR